MDLYLPETLGEWLAWLPVFLTFLWGLLAMAFPRLALRLARLRTMEAHPDAISEARSILGGAFAGFSLIILMFHPQPLLYLAFGVGFLGIVIGRLLSFLFDRSITRINLALTAGEGLAAFFPIAYVFGWIA